LYSWIALLTFGLYSAGLCLIKGLNQTNMDNRFAFGLWIFLDLAVIALGAGAFFTGFLVYILKIKELRAVINSAVVIGLDLIVRTAGPPEAMLSTIRDAVHRFERNLPVYNLSTMNKRLSGQIAYTRSFALLLSFFSASALLLAALGVYGVLAAGVSQRTQELGVRRALGAQRGDLLRLVVRHGIILAAAGAGTGTLAALGLARFARTLLYGVTSADPAAFLAAAVVLSAVAVLACLLPAWRATRVDPVIVLRYE
jgi:ABC-type antimicrobial peptide transport system permease subunit